MPWWHRTLIVVGVVIATLVVAKLVDMAIARRLRTPEATTRYRVLRRTVVATIIFIGVLSALLAIPHVRAIAGGLLASTAVLGIVVGFASQRTLGNIIAGLMIAFSQPLRIGDFVEVGGVSGRVEEIALSYTFIRLADGSRLVIPNEKLASDTILNSSIVSREKMAEASVQVPLASDLTSVLELLDEELASERRHEVFVSALDAVAAVITLRAAAEGEAEAERLTRDLRLRAHERLRAAGVLG
jgi:small-conductance mechanosensitive channel